MSSLPENVIRLRGMLRACTLCPSCCRTDRTADERGGCRIGVEAVVASAGPHFGEERVLVGSGGSGTIFFAGCNLHCAYCQNGDLSQSAEGIAVSPERLADLALDLQHQGCANVNFVTPTHVAHAVAAAVARARGKGLTIPIVYNCGGYESPETLRLLAGLIDIYMPDFKYASDAAGRKYSGIEDYCTVATAALAEMHRQVGPLATNGSGLARRGVLVRHLVLPGDLADSRDVIQTVADRAPGCAINVMAQYRPAHRAGRFPELQGRPSPAEMDCLRDYAAECGLRRVDQGNIEPTNTEYRSPK